MQILKKGKIIKPPLDADKKQESVCSSQVNSTFSDSTALQLLNVEVAKKRAGKSAVCAANYTLGA